MKELYSYLSFFEQAKTNDEMLIVESTLLYTTYSSKVDTFFDHFYHSELIDYKYNRTLSAYGVSSDEEMAKAIPTANFELLKAIFTKVIREERFVSGAFIHYVKEDIVSSMLKRLAAFL